MNQARCAALRTGSAYHEAGHSLLAATHGLLGARVTIDKTSDCSGVEGGETKIIPPRNRDELQRDIKGYTLLAVAGREAQTRAILLGLVPYESDGHRGIGLLQACMTDDHDRKLVAEYLGLLGEPADKAAVRRRYDDEAAPVVQRILRREKVWTAVRAIATALLKERNVSRRRVFAIMRATGVGYVRKRARLRRAGA